MSESPSASPSLVPAGGRAAVVAHVTPFVAWLALMVGLDHVGSPGVWRYAVRTVVCLILALWLRPWRWYKPMRLRHAPAALAIGVLVFLIWVLPEMRRGETLSMVQELYLRFAILPFGQLAEPSAESMYAPLRCGWTLTLVRLAGSALVIAVIEEFFWRGFLYRWLLQRDFLQVDLGEFDAEMFLIMCVLFGFEHDRWLVGLVAGACYGALALRTRDIWAACLAHVVTNLLLGVYVIYTAAYEFW